MQAISVTEARKNFKKYCDDVVENNDVIIVSRNGDGKENMVWIDLAKYNELQKAKENLEYMMKLEESYKQLKDRRVVVKTMDELEAMAAAPSSPRMTDAPRGSGDGASKIEKLVEEIDDLKALIAAKQIQCIHEKNRLERYISGIDDSHVRTVFSLRFEQGLSWDEVASKVGGGNSVGAVKKCCYRYLKKH